MVHCPPLPDSSSSSVVLHDRVLSGVVALGLFAVESELAHHGDKVLHYLLQLLESLPRASWVQNTLASAKRGGRRGLVYTVEPLYIRRTLNYGLLSIEDTFFDNGANAFEYYF